MIIGDKDPYFNEEVSEKLDTWIDHYKLAVDFKRFDGEHKMDTQLLSIILKEI